MLVILLAFGCANASDNSCDEISLLQDVLSPRHLTKHREKTKEPEPLAHLAAELGRPSQPSSGRHEVETELGERVVHELREELDEYSARQRELREIPETEDGQQQRLARLQELEEMADDLAQDFNQLAQLDAELGELEASGVRGTPSLLETHSKESGTWELIRRRRRRRRRFIEAVVASVETVVASVAETVDTVQDSVGEIIDNVQDFVPGEGLGIVDWAQDVSGFTAPQFPQFTGPQFTPDQADWSTLTAGSIADDQIGHDPDSILWISQAAWAEAAWDGTPYDPGQLSKQELADAICVGGGDRVRGIRQLFYLHQPFADNANPTKAEVDEWHRLVLTHVRALVGYTGPEYEAVKDHCLFAQALWANQRKQTTDWDTLHPTGSHCAGPCSQYPGGCAGHCGSTFLPSVEEQAPFLPEGSPEFCTLSTASTGQGRAEGIFSVKSRIPWSIKWSRSFCHTLREEGFFGGHTGPWFGRQKFGFDFWDSDPNNPQSSAVLRAKWSGNLVAHQYTCNPSIHSCR